jgi:predicted RNA-binding protein with PUA-like domain
VDLRAMKPLRKPVTLDTLRKTKGLEKMPLLRRANRLSVMPVTPKEWDIIVKLGS